MILLKAMQISLSRNQSNLTLPDTATLLVDRAETKMVAVKELVVLVEEAQALLVEEVRAAVAEV